MTTYQKIAVVFLGYLLGSGNAFADREVQFQTNNSKPAPPKTAGWYVEVQEKNGSWRKSYERKTEAAARSFADAECIRWKSPVKIVDAVSGKEHAFYCDPRTGKITDDGKPAPVVMLTEPEANKHAQDIRRQCESNYFMKSVFSCGCIEDQAKAEALRSDTNVTQANIIKKVTNPPISNQCVNREDLYKYVYESCASVLKSTRPGEAEEICTCTAKKTEADFSKDPVFNLGYFERLRNAAMKQCLPPKKAS